MRRPYRPIMILGGGDQQIKAVMAVKRRGFEAFVVDGNPQASCRAVADEFACIDISDVTACLALARRVRPQGVMTIGTEWAMSSLAAITSALDLPGLSESQALILRDKERLHKLGERAGVRMASYRCADNIEHARAVVAELPTPWICKPVDGAGSRGVSEVVRTKELPRAFARALSASRVGRVCIETAIRGGVEFGAQVVVQTGQIRALWIHNDEVLSPPKFGPLGHSLPYNYPEVVPKIEAVIATVIRSLPEFEGALNFDFMLVGVEVVMIEVGGRLGGAALADLIEYHSGQDVCDLLVSAALGERIETRVGDHANGRAVASAHVASAREGYFRPDLDSLGQLSRASGVLRVDLHVEPGDYVRSYVNASDAVGTVFAVASQASEAALIARGLAARIARFVDGTPEVD